MWTAGRLPDRARLPQASPPPPRLVPGSSSHAQLVPATGSLSQCGPHWAFGVSVTSPLSCPHECPLLTARLSLGRGAVDSVGRVGAPPGVGAHCPAQAA